MLALHEKLDFGTKIVTSLHGDMPTSVLSPCPNHPLFSSLPFPERSSDDDDGDVGEFSIYVLTCPPLLHLLLQTELGRFLRGTWSYTCKRPKGGSIMNGVEIPGCV